MADKASNQIMDILHAKESESRVYSQKFESFNQSITHQNRLQVQRTQKNTEEIEITNSFAIIEGGHLVKVTEIRFEDRLIKIIDSLTSIPLPSSVNQPSSKQKAPQPKHGTQRTTIFDRRSKATLSTDDQEIGQMRDTKNLVKNIFRLFESWVEEHLGGSIELRETLRGFLQSVKYNNNLVINLSKQSKLREAFMIFCDGSGQELIGKSKIRDKRSHLEALKQYQRICLNESIEEQERAPVLFASQQ